MFIESIEAVSQEVLLGARESLSESGMKVSDELFASCAERVERGVKDLTGRFSHWWSVLLRCGVIIDVGDPARMPLCAVANRFKQPMGVISRERAEACGYIALDVDDPAERQVLNVLWTEWIARLEEAFRLVC